MAACSECARTVSVIFVMEPGRDGQPYTLCARCYFFRTPYRPPADPAPATKPLEWTGGAHYVPDGDQFW